MGFAAIQTLVGVTLLSELGIDVSKNWLAYRITGLGNPVANQDAATKAWVLTQSPFSGLLSALEIDVDKDWQGFGIDNLADPSTYYSAATKKYVDEQVALRSRLYWKNTSENALTLANQAASISWTDLDLTAYTSANAKIAILLLQVSGLPTSGSYFIYLQVRKNGTTPVQSPYVSWKGTYGVFDQAYESALVLCGIDTLERIEYALWLSGSGTADASIDVLGYIE